MVPQHSPPPNGGTPELRSETIEHLREALMQRWRMAEGSEQRLRAVLRDASAEAREKGVRPEALIVTLESLEGEVFARPDAMRSGDTAARRRFREWLVSTCLEAYFGDGQ